MQKVVLIAFLLQGFMMPSAINTGVSRETQNLTCLQILSVCQFALKAPVLFRCIALYLASMLARHQLMNSTPPSASKSLADFPFVATRIGSHHQRFGSGIVQEYNLLKGNITQLVFRHRCAIFRVRGTSTSSLTPSTGS